MMNSESLLVVSLYNPYSQFFRKYLNKFKKPSDKDNPSRFKDETDADYEVPYTRRQAIKWFKSHGLKVVGEWRKMPELVRLLTGKGGMMTFCLKKL